MATEVGTTTAEVSRIHPRRRYSTGQLAQRLASNKRDGCLHPTTIAKYIVKGVRLPDGTRLHLRATKQPGGWIVLGGEALEFLAAYHEAYGLVGSDPSDASCQDPSDVSDASGVTAPRGRSGARKPKPTAAARR
jgi:hypothetical protein